MATKSMADRIRRALAAQARFANPDNAVSKARPFVPPPFVTKSASTRARYKRLGLCEDCGSGWHVRKKGRIEVTCHHPSCPTLQRIVAIEDAGFCAQCGSAKKYDLKWDVSMGCGVRIEWCPKWCSHGREWVWPDHLTGAERKRLGLRRVRAPRKEREHGE